jgi:pectate lyase
MRSSRPRSRARVAPAPGAPHPWLLVGPLALALSPAACIGDIGGGGGGGGDDDVADAGNTTTSDANLEEGVRAFPGAEGFGALATGGRGGRVLKVTTLAASGPGSLQDALDQNEPRIIVFAVSGVIEGDVEVTYGDVTIAGQTAPGGGITLHGRLIGAYDFDVGNIVVRHLRVRPEHQDEPGEQFDSIQFSRNHMVLLDHVSVAFGVDETVDLYEAEDVTVQWSTIEMSATEGHPEGEHNYGLINGPTGRRASIHHTLFAHHQNRCPAIANGPAEIRNNVAFDVRHAVVHHNPASGPFNIVGNTFRAGPSAALIPFYFDDENEGAADDLGYYLHDNRIDDPSSSCDGVVEDPWSECDQDLYLDASYRVTAEHDFSATPAFVPITTHGSAEAYELVLARAGAFPRDVVTTTAVEETRARTGSWGARIPADLMEGLSPTSAPPDRDDDGMPDGWEQDHGLDPDRQDHDTVMPSGYTAIEEYLNAAAELLL